MGEDDSPTSEPVAGYKTQSVRSDGRGGEVKRKHRASGDGPVLSGGEKLYGFRIKRISA